MLWSAEAECIMQGISQFCSCIDWLITNSIIFHEIHFLQGWQDLLNGILVIKFSFQIPVNNQCDETSYEVSKYLILAVEINWTCFKICFHDPETFFNLPAMFIRFNDTAYTVIKVRAYCIKAIIFCFFINNWLIDITDSLFSNLPFFCSVVRFYKTFRVILNVLIGEQ